MGQDSFHFTIAASPSEQSWLQDTGKEVWGRMVKNQKMSRGVFSKSGLAGGPEYVNCPLLGSGEKACQMETLAPIQLPFIPQNI